MSDDGRRTRVSPFPTNYRAAGSLLHVTLLSAPPHVSECGARRQGAADPPLNGYEIANPCFLTRIPQDELQKLLEGYGFHPHFFVGDQPERAHQQLTGTLDAVIADIKQIQRDARTKGTPRLPQLGSRAAYAKQAIRRKLIEHERYIRQHGDEMPEIRGRLK